MNAIALAKSYVPLLDAVYQTSSLTSALDGASELAQAGANANELIIPTLTMQGLGKYSRNDGYVKGDVTMTNKTVTCNFDRGRMFSVDNMDNAETAGLAFGRLAGEFIRTKVVPELDAFRFAQYASKTGIGSKSEDITTGEGAVKALRTAIVTMDDAEVPPEERYLFITSTILSLIEDMDTTASKAVLAMFAKITKVPQGRFYTAITQNDGTTKGQEAGGFAAATTGKALNFMVIHKPAVIQFEKHIAPKIITPEANQNADAWKYGYRNVGIADAYANKLAGIYENHVAT
ncbi:MAG: hypothetical protein GXZ14_00860 [Ruminococcaceae bacterium]|nr:hypothetical protein [Oscillospiraceae bacterium]